MKKLFFSAVALVAFSSVSMGNNIDINSRSENEEKEIVNNVRTNPTECLTYKFYYYNHLISIGATPEQASAGASSVYFDCMGRALGIR